MGQNHIVAAFRKRIYNRGYRNISIVARPDIDSAFPSYLVTATDPVFNCTFSKVFTELTMRNIDCKVLSGKDK